jgi:hypothetical protein
MAVKQQGNELIFTGIAYYAQVHKPSQFGNYKVDLVVDDETASELRKIGLKQASSVAGEDDFGNKIFKPKVYEDHPGKCFSFKRKTTTRTGATMSPPIVVGPTKEPFTDPIGNGSKVNVKIGLYPTKDASGKEMQGAGLNALQVVELVEFKSDDTTKFSSGNLEGFESLGSTQPSGKTTNNAVDF